MISHDIEGRKNRIRARLPCIAERKLPSSNGNHGVLKQPKYHECEKSLCHA